MEVPTKSTTYRGRQNFFEEGKTMRRAIFIIILSAFITGSSFAAPHGAADYGGLINYSQENDYAKGSGGEFTITEYQAGSLLLSNSAYAASTSGILGSSDTISFQTFCVEKNEYINPNPSSIYVSQAWADLSTPGSHAYGGGNNANGNGDDLDPRTAYLYTQFATGNLASDGYVYTPGSAREDSAAALQHVIWGIEGEYGSGWSPNPADTLQVKFFDAANDAYAAGWTTIGNVRVLQFFDVDGNQLKQDQLYLTPVPAAVLLGMLGFGAAGLKLRKFV